jgi:TatD DNase family protein
MPADFYIDIHTHHGLPDRPDVISIKNILMQDARNYASGQGFRSLGLHPWESDTVSLDTQLFEEIIARPEMIAIGECGLDRLRGADMKKQTGLFIRQALIAEARHKPLFIHCVRAWQEIIALKADLLPAVPWMIHGYRGKARVARQLLDNGFYLSFGENILWMNPVLTGIVNETPVDRLFLETDEGSRTIELIYQAAAKIKNLSLIKLQQCMAKNFETVSGIHGTSRMASAY